MDWKNTVLGLELGSTRIKAVLLGRDHVPLASGSFEWENKLENGLWTYSLAEAEAGLQACFAALKRDAEAKTGEKLRTLGAIGVSGMMHGYLPFDGAGRQLVPFRTWRNTVTGPAAAELTELFGFNVPQRWSVAHLRQAVLNGEAHVPRIAFLTTLAGYVHWQLTGQKVLGIGDASGMFPVVNGDYNAKLLRAYDALGGHRPLHFPVLL